ncbi:MAG: hypothetical protein ACRYG7_43395 [Janthinobacterium lividum]
MTLYVQPAGVDTKSAPSNWTQASWTAGRWVRVATVAALGQGRRYPPTASDWGNDYL